MYILIILLLQNSSTMPTSGLPSGWSVLGWAVAVIVGAIYLFSGVLQNLASGRKDLLEVSDKKLANTIKEKDELQFTINELNKQLEKMEKEKHEMERDKTMLAREHHALLEVSVEDLKTLRDNTKYIESLEEEINRFRSEKGLPPRTRKE
jgi:predicted nuclease with TOPRIM domain